jgi:hypothetical protein
VNAQHRAEHQEDGMRINHVTIGVILLTLLLLSMSAMAQRGDQESRTFEGIEAIRINTVSGDCIIQKGNTDKVEVDVTWSYRPRDSFEPKFRERGSVLKLEEDIYYSNSGHSTWTLTVPENIEIRFNSASGDLEVVGLTGEFTAETASGDIATEDCNGEFDFNTASGDIEMRDCRGRYDLNTASGEIEMDDCEGEFAANTASGSIQADGVTLSDVSNFNTASGRVLVVLAATAEHDLMISTASGRVTLDYGGNPIKGYFEFSSKYRKGRIVSPIDFEDEERYRRWGDRYVRKWFTKDADTPQIFIETASGKAVLREG